jgi:hypothetical protein
VDGGVALQSRQHKSLTPYFPEVTAAVVEQVPAGTVLDGELVVYRGGRCDFAALAGRISSCLSPAVVASFVVFDAGRTGPLTLPARREIGAVLVAARQSHPWPERIPSSRFGQLPGELVDYTQTEPLLVVEVDADVSFEHDRWRHPTRYRRVRSDLRPMDPT